MDKLIKREKENRILKEIYRREKLFVKNLINIPELPKNSIYRHIKELINQKLIEKISDNPIVVIFPLGIKIFLMKIRQEELVRINDLIAFINTNDLNSTEILQRFIEADILKITFKEKIPNICLVENTVG